MRRNDPVKIVNLKLKDHIFIVGVYRKQNSGIPYVPKTKQTKSWSKFRWQ